jgi:hypothetical protein
MKFRIVAKHKALFPYQKLKEIQMDPMFSLNNFDSEELLMIGHKWEQEHGR